MTHPPYTTDTAIDALVIGAGPAGLMAAEELARAGLHVTVAEAMPSPARKFLMAGKSGLNLTKNEPTDRFQQAFGTRPAQLETALRAFGPAEIQDWATGLGQSLFTGSSGRVFPTVMKASPLLRSWLGRLDTLGVTLNRRWRWVGMNHGFLFGTPDGPQRLKPRATVLALGGASWARLGSDGHWSEILGPLGIGLNPFQPANMGFCVDWSPHMTRHFGAPVKGVVLQAGTSVHRGEFVISNRGIEGGGIYAMSRAMREGAALTIDLMPDWKVEKIAVQLAKPRGKQSFGNHLRRTLKLDPVKQALLMEFIQPLPDTAELARLIKALPIRHAGPRPMDEAISTAGGVRFEALDDHLMLTALPGTFCVGEMLDWEAPTGGYLLTACLATGRMAGQGAVRWLAGRPDRSGHRPA
jgi:uncharacterized flavoprotein (TIGR03862 family)